MVVLPQSKAHCVLDTNFVDQTSDQQLWLVACMYLLLVRGKIIQMHLMIRVHILP